MTDSRLHEADTHIDQLRAALEANGITLPSLGLELPSAACTYGPPLIALGNCNLATAHALAAALRKAAGQ